VKRVEVVRKRQLKDKMKRRKKTPAEKEALIKLCEEHARTNDSEKNLRKKLRNVANIYPLLGYKAA